MIGKFTNIIGVEKFRAWVQFVLPTVYDDSLSYVELLAKVLKHLNTMNDNQEIMNGEIKELYDTVKQIETSINNISDLALKKGEGNNSIIANDINNNKVLSQNGIATGTNTTAGCMGYYYKAIDLANKIIYLSPTQVKPPVIGNNLVVAPETMNIPNSVVGKYINIINSGHWDMLIKVVSIDGSKITYEEDAGGKPLTDYFTTAKIPTTVYIDEWSISFPELSTVGSIVITEGGFATGEDCHAYGDMSFVSGYANLAGNYSAVFGVNNLAGYGCLVIGIENRCCIRGSFINGYGCLAVADYADAHGLYCKVLGINSTARGEYCEAHGRNSFSSGYKCFTYGLHSTSMGRECKVYSSAGVAGGRNNITGDGLAEILFGVGLRGNSKDGQTVVGTYNAISSEDMFMVGGGTGENARRNIVGFGIDSENKSYMRLGTAKITAGQINQLLAILTNNLDTVSFPE